ncbi:MAG: hypothetical protein AB8H86_02735 [Polyangiales bacterium]
MRKCVLGALLLPLLWCTGTSSAFAQDNTAIVLNFDGPGNRRVRNYVVRGIQRQVELLPVRRAESAASSAGVEVDTREGLQAAAEETGATILIRGRVRGRGRRARLSLRAYDARGVEIASSESNAAPGRTGRRRVAAASRQLLEQAQSNIESRESDEDERDAWEDMTNNEDDDDEEEEEDDDDDDDGETISTGWPRIRVVVGAEARDRNANVTFEPNRGERGYVASFHGEIHVRAESFPLGRADNGSRGLYLEGEFAHSISLSTEDTSTPDENTPIDSSAWRLMIQIGYVFPVAEDAVRFGILAGFGVDAFSLADNGVLASTSYSQLRVGAMASIRLLENKLRVRIDGAYRHGLSVGDIGDDFGDDGTAAGFDLGATLEGRFGSFVFGVRAGVTRYGLNFSGDATEPIATGANEITGKDRAFNLGLQLGAAFD